MSKQELLTGKNTPERIAIAKSLQRARLFDRGESGGEYMNDADLLHYLIKLQGLAHFMEYARELEGPRLVLDIGAGTTRAIAELANSRIGEDLNFGAVILSRDDRIPENFGYDRTIQTEVERLRGIEDQSVSGIISRSGISYSAVPEAAVASVDRVLVPGGAIKACFRRDSSEQDDALSPITFGRTYGKFAKAWLELGYDVAVSDTFSSVALLAVKPGGANEVGADKLMAVDNGVRDYLARVHGEI
jgi:SAM-dependent methyltransferase